MGLQRARTPFKGDFSVAGNDKRDAVPTTRVVLMSPIYEIRKILRSYRAKIAAALRGRLGLPPLG